MPKFPIQLEELLKVPNPQVIGNKKATLLTAISGINKYMRLSILYNII